MQNWRRNWLEDFDEFRPEHLKISKFSTLMAPLWPKYIMFDLKKYRGIMLDSTEYGLWWDSFVQSWKYMSLRFTGELCVMRMKNDAKLKRNWLLNSKLTWGIWQILIQALKNHKNFHFHGLPLTKVFTIWAKKIQESYVWWHWILTLKIWRKTDLCFQK